MKEAIAKMQTATRAEEGCQTYAFSVDISDPGMNRVTECWRSVEGL